MPVRVQRKRTKGWRMPKGAIYVGRPTIWGNPVTKIATINWHLGDYMDDRLAIWREEAVAVFRLWITGETDWAYHDPGSGFPLPKERPDLAGLRGRDLCCWCRLDQPCHADILLEIANAPLKCEAA